MILAHITDHDGPALADRPSDDRGMKRQDQSHCCGGGAMHDFQILAVPEHDVRAGNLHVLKLLQRIHDSLQGSLDDLL
jgi:hypothetical protein